MAGSRRSSSVLAGRGHGIARSRAPLISRKETRRFGTGTADRLAGLLRDLAAQEDLDRVGDWIPECSSGGELLSRVSSLLPDRQE